MKSLILFPSVLLLAGILGFVFFPHARTIPSLLIVAGLLWMAYAYITSQRRKV